MTKQSTIGGTSSNAVSVLSVSPNHEDHSSLEAIFNHSNWALYQADCLSAALRVLQEQAIGVILCERDLPQGTWIDVLERVSVIPDAPPLIVTSRLADDRLWSEALNLGVYDVLAKPFDRQEVVRSVSLAWLHWLRRSEGPARSMRMMRAAS